MVATIANALNTQDTQKMTATHKESLLSKLYQSMIHIEKCEPIIQMDDLNITAKELQNSMAKYIPHERSLQKAFTVSDDPLICKESITKVIKCMLKLQQVIGDESSRVLKCIRVEKFKDVKFVHSSVSETGVLKPAMFILQVPACNPNSVQCINTGYVLNVPKEVRKRSIVNKKIQIATEESEESTNFVIVPQILSKAVHILPQLAPRDPYDTGMFTVNLLNTTGQPAQVNVFLYAFLVRTNINGNDYSIQRQSGGKMIKPKDATAGNGRFIKNLDIGVYYEKGVIEDKKTVHFNLFDCKQDHSQPIPNDEIVIHNIPTLISSRKREWNNEKLFTISGMFLPMGTSCLPIVAKGSEYTENCFCITHVEARLELHTITGNIQPQFTMINGAMIDLSSYKVLRKTRKLMIRAMVMFKSAALACRIFDKDKYDYMELMRLADFGQVLSKEKMNEVDVLYQQRYNSEVLQKIDDSKNTHSQKLYNYFKILATVFCKPEITGTTLNLKRSITNDDNDDVDACKKNKIN